MYELGGKYIQGMYELGGKYIQCMYELGGKIVRTVYKLGGKSGGYLGLALVGHDEGVGGVGDLDVFFLFEDMGEFQPFLLTA